MTQRIIVDGIAQDIEIDDALYHQYDAENQAMQEPTTEQQNDALLQYVNDKTNGNYADLSAAVEGLVNNN